MDNDQMPRVQKVIISEKLVGKGVDDDPCRKLVYIHDLDGNYIAHNDPYDLKDLKSNDDEIFSRNEETMNEINPIIRDADVRD